MTGKLPHAGAGIVARTLSQHTPFFYGWLVLSAVCCAGFARQGPSVATLSIFFQPMTTEFGWSRTEISAAVSLAGVLAAIISPILGPMLDRHGARMMLVFAIVATGLALISLAFTTTLLFFYAAFAIARTCFAGPFDLGIYGAVNNWFLSYRAVATSIVNGVMMAGLVALPLIAQFTIDSAGWRQGWVVIGTTVLIIGLLPVWLLVARRPEDLGLRIDGQTATAPNEDGIGEREAAKLEPTFTRAQALRTPAFWLLNIFTFLIYPIQAGISLHQAPMIIGRGLDPTVAALAVATFSLFTGIFAFSVGFVIRRIGVKQSLLVTACLVIIGVAAMEMQSDATEAYVAAALFGSGVGCVLTVLPVAWADFFGRQSFGAIRGIALSVQVVGQAAGPLTSGVLADLTGNYTASHIFFGVCAFFALLAAAFVRPPHSAAVYPARRRS